MSCDRRCNAIRDQLLYARQQPCSFAAVGVARLCGFSVLEWVLSAISGLYLAVAGLVGLMWRLLHPDPDASTAALPDLHQVRTAPLSACSQLSNSQAADQNGFVTHKVKLMTACIMCSCKRGPLMHCSHLPPFTMPNSTHVSNTLIQQEAQKEAAGTA
jgi:hypothetical protein